MTPDALIDAVASALPSDTSAWLLAHRDAVRPMFARAVSRMARRGAFVDDELPPAPDDEDVFAGLRSRDTPMLDQVDRAIEVVRARYFTNSGLSGWTLRLLTARYGPDLVQMLMTTEALEFPRGWSTVNDRLARAFAPVSVLDLMKPAGGWPVVRTAHDAQAWVDDYLRTLGITAYRIRVTVARDTRVTWVARVLYGNDDTSASGATRAAALGHVLQDRKLWDAVAVAMLTSSGWTVQPIAQSLAARHHAASARDMRQRAGVIASRARTMYSATFRDRSRVYLDEVGRAYGIIQRALASAAAKGRTARIADVTAHLPRGWTAGSSRYSSSVSVRLTTPHGFVFHPSASGSKIARTLEIFSIDLGHIAMMSPEEFARDSSARYGVVRHGPKMPNHDEDLNDAVTDAAAWEGAKQRAAETRA